MSGEQQVDGTRAIENVVATPLDVLLDPDSVLGTSVKRILQELDKGENYAAHSSSM